MVNAAKNTISPASGIEDKMSKSQMLLKWKEEMKVTFISQFLSSTDRGSGCIININKESHI